MSTRYFSLGLLAFALVACGDAAGSLDSGAGDGALLDAADTSVDIGEDTQMDTGSDAPACPDADGDGFTSALCGGEDCNDDDPALSPERSVCTSNVTFLSCIGERALAYGCPPTSPACRADTGECVAAGEACGDGVVHAGEECDDGNDDDTDACLSSCLRPSPP